MYRCLLAPAVSARILSSPAPNSWLLGWHRKATIFMYMYTQNSLTKLGGITCVNTYMLLMGYESILMILLKPALFFEYHTFLMKFIVLCVGWPKEEGCVSVGQKKQISTFIGGKILNLSIFSICWQMMAAKCETLVPRSWDPQNGYISCWNLVCSCGVKIPNVVTTAGISALLLQFAIGGL